MRSRPKLELHYWPKDPRPGDTVHFEATLISRSETPVDAVQFRFRGDEERAIKTVSTGKAVMVVRAKHCHLDRELTVDGMLLAKGERKLISFRVVLPAALPPSWRSRLSAIEYILEVRVDIPWWPDRTARFVLPVGATPRRLLVRPRRSLNAPEGPRGTELDLELSLESAMVSLGALVRGAVAAINASHHRISRLEVCAVAFDSPSGPSRFGPAEVYRTEAVVLAPDAPEDGRSYPFELRLPDDVPPSFASQLVTLNWQLEARAVVSLGRDVLLATAIDVAAPDEERGDERVGAPRLAPVGSERRALVWAQVAQNTGLSTSDRAETLSGRFGDVTLEVAPELRGDQLHAVATLEWPSLGLDLTVTERRWTDAFKHDVTLQDEAFDGRFAVRGRDGDQVRALLDAELRGVLLRFERVALDDAGAQLASPGNGWTVEELEPFVRKGIEAATSVHRVLAVVPAPAVLAPHREAWVVAAQKWAGQFFAGDFSIRHGAYRGETVELVTRFDDAGAPLETAARLVLRKPAPAVLPPEAQRIFDSLATECSGLCVTPEAIEAVLPCPLADPLRAESLWRAQLRLVQAL